MRTAVSRLLVVGLGLSLGLVARPGLAGPPESSAGSQAAAAATPAPKDAPPAAGTAKAKSASAAGEAKNAAGPKPGDGPSRVYYRNGQPYDARLIQTEREFTCWTTSASAETCKGRAGKGQRCTLAPPPNYWFQEKHPSGAYDVAQRQQQVLNEMRANQAVPECRCTCGAINAKPPVVDEIPVSNIP